MNRRGAGVVFIAIASFLYGVRYLSAAIFGSGINSWNRDLFDSMLQYVGTTLNIFAVISLVAGLIYLIWSEVSCETNEK